MLLKTTPQLKRLSPLLFFFRKEPIMEYAKLDMFDYDIDDHYSDKDHNDIEVTIKLKDRGKYDATIADISTDITSKDNFVYVEGRRFHSDGISIVYSANVPYALIIVGKKI